MATQNEREWWKQHYIIDEINHMGRIINIYICFSVTSAIWGPYQAILCPYQATWEPYQDIWGRYQAKWGSYHMGSPHWGPFQAIWGRYQAIWWGRYQAIWGPYLAIWGPYHLPGHMGLVWSCYISIEGFEQFGTIKPKCCMDWIGWMGYLWPDHLDYYIDQLTVIKMTQWCSDKFYLWKFQERFQVPWLQGLFSFFFAFPEFHQSDHTDTNYKCRYKYRYIYRYKYRYK